MQESLKKIILSHTNSIKIEKIELIQKLWSGYGSLKRIKLDNGSVILKEIQFSKGHSSPKNKNSHFSHERKVKSYETEKSWYKNHNNLIEHAYSPRHITSGDINGAQYLLLEDLQGHSMFPKLRIEWEEVQLGLKWLAHFHKFYLNKAEGIHDLWNIGTYWHLNTRPEEFEKIENLKLKLSAVEIDKKLNSAKNKTLVHGDAKLGNFLFSNKKVAAVDFQYIGHGVGVKDLAYFLSSIYTGEELFQNEKACLDYYFTQLNTSAEIETEWRELYPYAWADFYRFLKGWSPKHYKINAYSEAITRKVIECL